MPSISVNISTGADDGNEYVTSSITYFYTYSATFAKVDFAGFFGTGHFGAFRFQSITVPQGATISSANLTFIKKTGSGFPVINIYGNNVNNSPAWGVANRVKNITKTVATTVLDVVSATSVNNVTTIVQAIINRAGWVSGNAMAFGLFCPGNFGSNWQCYTFEKGAPNIPNLSITYVSAGKIFGRGGLNGISIYGPKQFNPSLEGM